jgi:glycosyltransferase involved in cell wall biosynthesis
VYGWRRYNIPDAEAPVITAHTNFSIVIAYRNEEKHLPELLQSLNRLNYPQSAFEVVLVNDHSSDQSERIVKEFEIAHPGLNMRCIRATHQGKKPALYEGVQASRFNWIVFTDADGTVHENWLKAINKTIIQNKSELVMGPVLLPHDTNLYQQLEFTSLIGSTMAMLENGWPVMGNAANMAVDRSLYLEAYPELQHRGIPGGDDVFLLHYAHKNGKKIGILKGMGSVVVTAPQPDVKSLFWQRIRWASKSVRYQSRTAISVAMLVFMVNATLLLLLVGSPFSYKLFPAFALLAAAKWVADYIMLTGFCRAYQVRFSFIHFLGLECINLLYIPMVALLSPVLRYEWKDRRY